MRQERLVEVQPIIHREVEQPEVRVIEQHIYETVPSTGPSTITKPAIIQETVQPKIIEGSVSFPILYLSFLLFIHLSHLPTTTNASPPCNTNFFPSTHRGRTCYPPLSTSGFRRAC